MQWKHGQIEVIKKVGDGITEIKKVKPPILMLIAPRASGMSTTLKSLGDLYGPGFVGFDSSGACKEHIDLETPIGRELANHKTETLGGGFYPDELVVRANHEKICWETQRLHGQVFLIGIPGGLRTARQYELWQELGYTRIYALHVMASLREVFEGVQRREDAGEHRKDSEPSAVVKSYRMYIQHVLSAVDRVPIGRKCEIAKALSPLERLQAAVNLVDVPNRDSVRRSLKSTTHPVRVQALGLGEKLAEPVELSEEAELAIKNYHDSIKQTAHLHQPAHMFLPPAGELIQATA